ncbi:unnamed protein product [Coffea canephora]|uniref:Uncharacterized protein n=1 Tax=Coffea canephora TaxID=49390 RepID=A0A068U8P6_COFCA|nr:unnamed protein product [Coffea canephora]
MILLLLLLLDEDDPDGQPLVVTASDALQVVHAGQCPWGDGVELAGDRVAAAVKIEQEGNSVGPADERELVGGPAEAQEGGISGGHHVL